MRLGFGSGVALRCAIIVAVGVSALLQPALLLGELEFYPIAIWRMRTYLAPGASDARAAQDRIYEWEARLPREAPPQ